MRLLAILLLGAAGPIFSLWLWRRMAHIQRIPVSRVLFLMLAGALGALLASFVERRLLDLTDISLRPSSGSALGALLFMMLLSAPLEEALKVAAVWPHYARRKLTRGSLGATHAVIAAGGFVCVELVLFFFLWERRQWLDVLRATITIPAHFFFAGIWGYMLGGSRRDRFFGLVWLGCVALHGIYDHIVQSRGPAFMVVVVPMQAMMIGGTWLLLRAQRQDRGPSYSARSIFEPASVASMRVAISRRGQRLMIPWILFGVLVTVGVTLVFLGVSVYLGHRFGIDFSLADEAGLQGAIPIALLASALLLAFPFSGFLIARASGAVSVLEPAWATGAAIGVVLVLFSVTEPTALVIALAIAPVGLALACVGAWFGLERT